MPSSLVCPQRTVDWSATARLTISASCLRCLFRSYALRGNFAARTFLVASTMCSYEVHYLPGFTCQSCFSRTTSMFFWPGRPSTWTAPTGYADLIQWKTRNRQRNWTWASGVIMDLRAAYLRRQLLNRLNKNLPIGLDVLQPPNLSVWKPDGQRRLK